MTGSNQGPALSYPVSPVEPGFEYSKNPAELLYTYLSGVPGGDTVLGEGDVLILYATDGDIRRIEEVHSGKKEQA
jgi:hypothetical protein